MLSCIGRLAGIVAPFAGELASMCRPLSEPHSTFHSSHILRPQNLQDVRNNPAFRSGPDAAPRNATQQSTSTNPQAKHTSARRAPLASYGSERVESGYLPSSSSSSPSRCVTARCSRWTKDKVPAQVVLSRGRSRTGNPRSRNGPVSHQALFCIIIRSDPWRAVLYT